MSKKLIKLDKYLKEKDWKPELDREHDTIHIPPLGIIVEVEGELWFHPVKDNIYLDGLAKLIRHLEQSDFDYIISEVFGFEKGEIKFASDYKGRKEFQKRAEPFIESGENPMYR